jgi:hypothetical protein
MTDLAVSHALAYDDLPSQIKKRRVDPEISAEARLALGRLDTEKE